MSTDDEEAIHRNKLPGKTYISPSFPTHDGTRLRIASKVLDGGDGYEYAKEKADIILRRTPAARKEIIAKFLEDSRGIQRLTIQKFNKSGPGKEYFTFLPDEITKLLNFIANIRRVHFPDEGKLNVTDDELEDLLLMPGQAERILRGNPALVAALARTEITSEDVIALGYRRSELEIFDRLLNDQSYFEEEVSRTTGGPEGVWQHFFERNHWIFGYGLSYIFNTSLDFRALEQTVRGFNLTGPGKRVDALLKSQALIQSLCFVEIKRHDTRLVSESQYRSGVWAPSPELSGAIAQIQGTVFDAIEAMGSELKITDKEGDPTGEILHAIQPRSFVVIGSLKEFQVGLGVNVRRFRSFELCRKNTVSPEIITFDELYHRARFIVESAA
ncbi:MAG: DUF4263 domain-containing protein [Rhizobiaceae bacterium]|nr:DUF4263 domain-containing protein [Rhizobiaceae bacterium]